MKEIQNTVEFKVGDEVWTFLGQEFQKFKIVNKRELYYIGENIENPVPWNLCFLTKHECLQYRLNELLSYKFEQRKEASLSISYYLDLIKKFEDYIKMVDTSVINIKQEFYNKYGFESD